MTAKGWRRLSVPVGYPKLFELEDHQTLKHVQDAIDEAVKLGVPPNAELRVRNHPLGGVGTLRFRWRP